MTKHATLSKSDLRRLLGGRTKRIQGEALIETVGRRHPADPIVHIFSYLEIVVAVIIQVLVFASKTLIAIKNRASRT